MEFPSLAVSSDWCHAASCCCCHWQKFLSLIPMRRKKVSVLLLQQLSSSSIFCLLTTHLNANTDRIQNFKRNLLIGFVEGLCPRTSHFSSLKEKMKNTFTRRRELLLHLEFLPFLAATDISKGLTRTRQLYVCFKGLWICIFSLILLKPYFPNNQLTQKSFLQSYTNQIQSSKWLLIRILTTTRSESENCIVAVFCSSFITTT